MTRRRDHHHLHRLDRVRRVGSEDIRGAMPADVFRRLNKPVMPVATKAELRALADRAIAEWRATRASS